MDSGHLFVLKFKTVRKTVMKRLCLNLCSLVRGLIHSSRNVASGESGVSGDTSSWALVDGKVEEGKVGTEDDVAGEVDGKVEGVKLGSQSAAAK